jgi:hypothetical protein
VVQVEERIVMTQRFNPANEFVWRQSGAAVDKSALGPSKLRRMWEKRIIIEAGPTKTSPSPTYSAPAPTGSDPKTEATAVVPIPEDWESLKWNPLRSLARNFTTATIHNRSEAELVIRRELDRRVHSA